MSCKCKKGSTCAEHLAEADLSLDSRVSPPAFYEEQLRLLQNWYENARLARIDAEAREQRLQEALERLMSAVENENRKLMTPSKVWPMSINVRNALADARAALAAGGEQP